MDKKMFKCIAILITYTVLLILLIMNLKLIINFLMVLFSLLTPFFIGFALAFILNKPYKMFERSYSKMFKKDKSKKYVSILAITTTYLLSFAFLAALISFIVPQLSESTSTLVSNFKDYTDNFVNFIGSLKLVETFDIDISNFESIIQNLLDTAGNTVKTLFPYIFTTITAVFKTAAQLIFGVIISIYILASKNTLKGHVKGMIYAYIPRKKADKFYEIAKITSTTFSNFITGQLTEVIILGVICFFGMLVFKFPYAILISTIIGLTNVIPIVGPFIGALPATFIILLVNPTQALWFVVFITVIQQIEGNIIYPKVVGDSIGLPAIWVLLSILIGGGLFGVVGMILGVPLTSVIYRLLKKETKERLELQEIIKKKEAKIKIGN